MAAYQKQEWLDHIEDERGKVIQQGTAMDALHFNHIEDGIGNAQDSADSKTKLLIGGEKQDEIDLQTLIIILDGGNADGNGTVKGG